MQMTQSAPWQGVSRMSQSTLRLMLEDSFGKRWEVAMPIDAFDAMDRYVDLKPPQEFDMRTFDQTVEIIRKREYRKEDFRNAAVKLATALGERMEDEEGWHGISRQAHYENERKARP